MSKPNINDFPVLSNEDVELLYEIISTAQDAQAPPFRALFAAYDEVLAKHRISKDTDQVYFRFLLRMREGRKAGETLFQQFQTLLAKMDIQVRIDNERLSDDEGAQNAKYKGHVAPHEKEHNLLPQTQSLSRRVSFESAYDTLAEDRQAPFATERPLPKRARSTDAMLKSNALNKTDKQSLLKEIGGLAKGKPNGGRRGHAEGQPVDQLKQARVNGLTHAHAEQSSKYNGQQIIHESQEFQHNEDISTESASNYSEDVSDADDTDGTDLAIGASEPAPHPPHSRLAEMDSQAKSLRYYHTAARALRLFRHWQKKGSRANNNHAEMLKAAWVRDSNTLARQSFDQWRSALLQRKRERETENFFENLESRASYAHNLFLLQKAFTHWAQCAAEELQKTSAARQHLLKVKYFNAWRDITVVNELKVRRTQLGKFFGIWKSRSIRIFRQEEDAVDYYNVKCAERLYRNWFWHFCERRVPAWYEARLKSSIFGKWLGKLRQHSSWSAWAAEMRQSLLIHRVSTFWTEKSVVDQKNQQDAGGFRRRALLAQTLEALRKELTLAPIQRQIMQRRHDKAVHAALIIWSNKTRDSRKAVLVDKLRVVRNVWTKWNDNLRCRTLSKSIDDRVILEALYKWVLHERLALFQRVHCEKLMSSITSQWKQRTADLSASLGEAKYVVKTRQAQRSAKSVIVHWSANAQAGGHRESCAKEFRDNSLKSSAFQTWVGAIRTVKRHDDQANDARFYVLASRTVRKWRASTEKSRRVKRRDAYATLRRKNKMQLARNALDKWRSKSNALSNMDTSAVQFYHDGLLSLRNSLFDSWNERATDLYPRQERAYNFHEEHVLRSYFSKILARHRHIEDANAQAVRLFDTSVEDKAARILRELNWQLFQIRRKQETAASFEERTQKAHFRSMLRHWAEKTAEHREHPVSPSRSTRSIRFRQSLYRSAISLHGLVPDTEQQTEDISQEQVHVPSTPGYLSRRASKAKSRLPMPRTPATTQITPLKSRLQALTASNTGLRSTRSDYSRVRNDGLGRSVGIFEDIPETSPLRRED